MLDYSLGCSSIEREDFTADLFFNNSQWGEICLSNDKKSVNIIIYPNKESYLEFDCNEFLLVIEKAKDRLLLFEPLK